MKDPTTDEPMAYVVTGTSGEYSDTSWWVEAVFTTEGAAKFCIEKIEGRDRKRKRCSGTYDIEVVPFNRLPKLPRKVDTWDE